MFAQGGEAGMQVNWGAISAGFSLENRVRRMRNGPRQSDSLVLPPSLARIILRASWKFSGL